MFISSLLRSTSLTSGFLGYTRCVEFLQRDRKHSMRFVEHRSSMNCERRKELQKYRFCATHHLTICATILDGGGRTLHEDFELKRKTITPSISYVALFSGRSGEQRCLLRTMFTNLVEWGSKSTVTGFSGGILWSYRHGTRFIVFSCLFIAQFNGTPRNATLYVPCAVWCLEMIVDIILKWVNFCSSIKVCMCVVCSLELLFSL